MFEVRYYLKTPDTPSTPSSLGENEESRKIRVSLENPSTPARMRERLIMELRRVTGFHDILRGKGVSEEYASDVKKILAGKKSNNYFASDILSLKRKGVDVVPLLLADPYTPEKALSSGGLNRNQRLYVNFGENPNLQGNIGPGDILPPEITVISVGGNIGIRKEYPRPGYYGDSGYISISHGEYIDILEKRAIGEKEIDASREASHKRWALLRASDMVEFNNKNPLTDLPEDRSLFSYVTDVSRRVNQPSNIGRTRRESLNFIKNGEFTSDATQLAKRIQEIYGIPWQVTVGQAALETGYGKSVPNGNYFGIKGKDGGSFATTEFRDGKWVRETASFRSFSSMEESFLGYGEFLTTNPRYRSAFHYKDNPREFLRRIHQAGYATDPNYVAKIESIWGKMGISVV